MEAFEEMIGVIESDNPFGFYSCNLRSHTCSLSDRNWIIKMIIGKRSSSEKLAKRYHFRARSIRRWVQQARKTGYVTVRGGRPPLLDPVSITCTGIWVDENRPLDLLSEARKTRLRRIGPYATEESSSMYAPGVRKISRRSKKRYLKRAIDNSDLAT